MKNLFKYKVDGIRWFKIPKDCAVFGVSFVGDWFPPKLIISFIKRQIQISFVIRDSKKDDA